MAVTEKNAVMEAVSTKSSHMILELFKFTFDAAGWMGFGGTTLIIISGIISDIPVETGLVGLLVVFASVYQKVRKDRREQSRFKKAMEIVEKMLSGELPYDQHFITQFLDGKDGGED